MEVDHYMSPWNPESTQFSESILCTLIELKEKSAAYCTVSCRLIHEQVVEIPVNDVSAETDMEKLIVKRKGFCNREQRKKFLGCAHTRANDEFIHLAEDIYKTGFLKTEKPPSVILKDIFMKIYMLDQQKGTLEKRYACAKYISQSTIEMYQIKKSLEEIEHDHHCLIKELEFFRQSLINQLDIAIDSIAT